MNLVVLLAMLCLWTASTQVQASTGWQETHDCYVIHRAEGFDTQKHFLQLHGESSNGGCFLRCTGANKTLSTSAVYEGYLCPDRNDGICQHGVCVEKMADAQQQCSKLHNVSVDHFAPNHNRKTKYVNDHCTLRCAAVGIFKDHPIKEGQLCSNNDNLNHHLNGVCRNGVCVDESFPMPALNHTFKLESLQALIKSATLNDTRLINHSNFSISIGLFPFSDQPPFKPQTNGHVEWNYTTKVFINGTLGHPEDHQYDFDEHTPLQVNVYVNGLGGTFTNYAEKLNRFFRRHLSASQTTGGVLEFDERIPIYDRQMTDILQNWNGVNGVVAHVDVRFTIKYSLVK